MDNLFLTYTERCKRVEAMLKARQWSWYRLAAEMGVDYMTVTRTFKAGHKDPRLDPKISTIRALARATGTTAGFWIDKNVGGKK